MRQKAEFWRECTAPAKSELKKPNFRIDDKSDVGAVPLFLKFFNERCDENYETKPFVECVSPFVSLGCLFLCLCLFPTKINFS
jgi:hypothetical protein